MTKTEAMSNEAITKLLARATRAMNRANELERQGAYEVSVAKCDGRWLIYKSNHGGWIIKDMDYSCDEITREERTLKAAVAYCNKYDNY